MVDCTELSYNYETHKCGQLTIDSQWLYFTIPTEVYAQQVAVIHEYNENEFDRYAGEAGWEDWMGVIDEYHKNEMRNRISPDDDNYDDYMCTYDSDEPLEWTINTIHAIQGLLWREVYGRGSMPSIDPVALQNKPNTPMDCEWG